MDEPTRGDRSEFNPSPNRHGIVGWRMQCWDEYGDTGDLETALSASAVYGPDALRILGEVAIAARNRMKKQ